MVGWCCELGRSVITVVSSWVGGRVDVSRVELSVNSCVVYRSVAGDPARRLRLSEFVPN